MRACRRRAYAVFFFVAAACVPELAAAQRLRISVSGAAFRPYPIAVPDAQLTTDAKAGAEVQQAVAARLRLDVELARHFSLLPPASYLAAEKDPNVAPAFNNWQSVGASGLVRSTLATDGQRMRLVLRFYDVQAGKELVTRTCNDAVGGVSRCVHQFLDQVIEVLTGEPGVFSSRVAFVRQLGKNKAIYACDVDGDNVEKLVDAGSLNLLPSWDATGRSLIYTSYATGRSQLMRRALASGNTELLSGRRGLNMAAATSPDGRRIALTLSVDGNTEIYVMDLDGKNLTRLTNSWGQDVSPTWSPDGRRIAFVSSRSGSPHIYVMNADGSDQRRLTFRGTYNQEPNWSPRRDGRILFTARDERYTYDLFAVHPDTGEVVRLTQDAGNNDGPSHAPDGHHVVFTSTRGKSGTRELYVMDVDGQSQRPILEGVGGVENPTWGPRLGY